MAQFTLEMPTEIQKDLERIYQNSYKIFGDMTRAGAEYVASKVKGSVPHEGMADKVKVSKTYKTPSDDGINTKVYFSGYLPFKPPREFFSRRGKSGGQVYSTTKGVPVDFLAILFEYGRSGYPFPKKPFFRKAFQDGNLEQVMREEQKKASGGILE